MNFLIASKFQAESKIFHDKEVGDKKHIWISISSPWPPYRPVNSKIDGVASIPDSIYRLDTLYMIFEDTTLVSNTRMFFNNKDAESIIDFALKYKDKVNLIVVNCEMGIARSSAIALVLSEWLNDGDDLEIMKTSTYYPNSLIVKTLREELESRGVTLKANDLRKIYGTI